MHMSLLRRLVDKGLNDGITSRFTQFEEAIVEDIRLFFCDFVSECSAVFDELFFTTLFHGHPGDEGYIGQGSPSLSQRDGARCHMHVKSHVAVINNSIGGQEKLRWMLFVSC